MNKTKRLELFWALVAVLFILLVGFFAFLYLGNFRAITGNSILASVSTNSIDQWASYATALNEEAKWGAGYAIGANAPVAQGSWIDTTAWCKTNRNIYSYLVVSFEKRVIPSKIEIYFAGPNTAGTYGFNELYVKDAFTGISTRIDTLGISVSQNGAVYTITNLPAINMTSLTIVTNSGTLGCVDAVKLTGVESKWNNVGGVKTLNVNFLEDYYNGDLPDPFILKEGSKYYLYATGGSNIQMLQSKDFLHWGWSSQAFVNNYINTYNKLGWSSSPVTNYDNIWAPDVMKINSNTYLMGFSANEIGNNGQTTAWSAYASSPSGPFGPTNFYGTNAVRMYEPTPLRNPGGSYNSNSVPHSEPYVLGCPRDGKCEISVRIDTKYFQDGGDLWGVYTYFGDNNNLASGNYNGIVNLNLNDPTLTHSDGRYFKLIDSHAVIYDSTTGKKMHMCAGTNADPTSPSYVPANLCIAEGGELVKLNNKYYLFYAANYFDGPYSVYYKMANTLDCLALGRENDVGCGVKQGIVYDGVYSKNGYNYGHGSIFYGPSNELLFSIVVMNKEIGNRKTWIVPLQFDSQGIPITMAPTPSTTFQVTIPSEICNNNLDEDFDDMIDCADPDCVSFSSCIVCNNNNICNLASGENKTNCPNDCKCSATIDCNDNNICTTETCSNGRCSISFNTNSCSDGNLCTNDVCSSGTCVGTAKNCNDGDSCTSDSCSLLTGSCFNVFNNSISGCSCTTDLECEDNNLCTTNTCVNHACVFSNNNVACNDGDSCTTNDKCSNGFCLGSSLNCGDSDSCTNDFCISGFCQHIFNNSISGCSCNSDVNCNDNNICTTDACNLGSHSCSFVFNSNSCNDNNPCTDSDVCSSGICIGSLKNCNDANSCTVDSCVSGNCQHVFDNTLVGCKCSSNNECEDNNPCTLNICSLLNDCSITYLTSPCEDNNTNTINDFCVLGTCIGESICNTNGSCDGSRNETCRNCPNDCGFCLPSSTASAGTLDFSDNSGNQFIVNNDGGSSGGGTLGVPADNLSEDLVPQYPVFNQTDSYGMDNETDLMNNTTTINAFKLFFIKLICRLSHLFDSGEYSVCVEKYI